MLTSQNTLTSPSALSFSRLPGDGGNVNQSSSESSLITASTQSSGESSRPGHRVLAGRQSWTAGNAGWSPNSTKLRPRRTTIDESLEEEDLDAETTLMELIKASPEPEVGSRSESTHTSAPARDAGPRHLSASMSNMKLMEELGPKDAKEEQFARSQSRPFPVRSASESISDHGPNGTYRSARNPRTDQTESRSQSRELASFLSTTAPPQRSASAPYSSEDSFREQSKRHKLKDLMSRIGPYRRDRIDPHDPPPAMMKMPWDKDRQPVSSADFHKLRQPSATSNQSLTPTPPGSAPKSLRSQRSVSSVGTASASSVPATLPNAASAKDVLRKPSLMRKWAHQVTEPARQRRTSASSRGLTSPLLSQSKSRLSEVEEDTADAVGASSRALGLGLGGLGLGMPPLILESERSNIRSDLEHDAPAGSAPTLPKDEVNPRPKSSVSATGPEVVERLKEAQIRDLQDASGNLKGEPPVLLEANEPLPTDVSPRPADAEPALNGSSVVAEPQPLAQDASRPRPPELSMPAQAPSPSLSQGSSSRQSLRPLPERPGDRRTSRELPKPPQPNSASPTASISPRVFSKQEFPSPHMSSPELRTLPEAPAEVVRSPTLRRLPEVPDEEHMLEPASAATVKASSLASLTQPLRHDRVAELSAHSTQSPKDSPSPLQHNNLVDSGIDGGYVHVSELTHLRSLLENATTVRECQIMVDCVLTRLGVPRDVVSGDDHQERVTEWLRSDSSSPSRDNVSELQTPNGSPRLKLKTHRSSLSAGSGKRVISRKSSKGTTVESHLSPDITMKNLPALPGPAASPDHSSPSPTVTPPTPTAPTPTGNTVDAAATAQTILGHTPVVAQP